MEFQLSGGKSGLKRCRVPLEKSAALRHYGLADLRRRQELYHIACTPYHFMPFTRQIDKIVVCRIPYRHFKFWAGIACTRTHLQDVIWSQSKKELVTVPGLDRGLEILEFLSSSERGKTQMEIADALHLPVSSVARITLQLEATGWLSRNPDSRVFRLTIVFRLTMKMLTMWLLDCDIQPCRALCAEKDKLGAEPALYPLHPAV